MKVEAICLPFFSLLIVEKIYEKGYNFDLLEKTSFFSLSSFSLLRTLVFLMAMLANLVTIISKNGKKKILWERKLPIVRSKQLLVFGRFCSGETRILLLSSSSDASSL